MPEPLVRFRGAVRCRRAPGPLGLTPREWVIAAAAVHLHHEIAAQFYRAIPPRPVPPSRRWLWRIVLALAATRAGLAVLRALRR